MIGVLTEPVYQDAAREFFELFKTPWEWVVTGKNCEVIFSTVEPPDMRTCRLLLMMSPDPVGLDEASTPRPTRARPWRK